MESPVMYLNSRAIERFFQKSGRDMSEMRHFPDYMALLEAFNYDLRLHETEGRGVEDVARHTKDRIAIVSIGNEEDRFLFRTRPAISVG